MANTLTATFGLDISPLQRAARRAIGVVGSMARRTAAIGARAATAGAALLGVGSTAAVLIATKRAYDLGGQLSDLAAKTVIAADQIMILNQAAKDNGIENISASVAKMQAALVDAAGKGTGPAAEALALLGLRAQEIVKQSPIAQIKAIGQAMQTIQNPALKTSIARDLFGRGGADMLTLFNDTSALDTATAAIGRQAQILGENAAKFDAISDRLGRAGLKSQGFFVGLASTVLPLMEKITERMDKADFATAGEKFGEKLKEAVNLFTGAFADPLTLVGAIGDGLTYALLSAANWFKDAMIMAVEAIGPKLLRAVGKALSYLPGVGWDMGKNLFDKAKGIELNAGATLGKDHFGAEKFKQYAEGAAQKLKAAGEKAVDAWVGAVETTVQPPPGRFDSFRTAFQRSSLSTGGLTGASMAGTLLGSSASGASPFDFSRVADLSRAGVRSGPILSAAERRAFEDAAVSAGGTRSASTVGAYGTIRAGDAARRKNAERERERERLKNENSVARSNELLTKVVESTTRTAEALE